MQNPVVALFIFIFILFLYIHITSQWKTSDDLEVYEADYENPRQLQEVCSVKQPVLFKLLEPEADDVFSKFQALNMEKYDNVDVRIKDSTDYVNCPKEDTAVNYVVMSLRSARRLMTTDTTAKYFSECNHDFLEDSGLDVLVQLVDPYLKPPLCAYVKHDMLLGSPNIKTPLRYRLETHNYIATTKGKIRVKLCPPKYTKVLPVIRDYENYEFRTPVDVWNPKNVDVLSKIKTIDVEVQEGFVLFLPAYWWYSIEFSEDPDTTVLWYSYDILMNIPAQSKHWGLYYLQQSNIKTNPGRPISRNPPSLATENSNESETFTSENPASEPSTSTI